MKLRPHHILDIISKYGHGFEFKPHPYGHALHSVALSITSDMNQEVELIIGSDEICIPCIHLQPDGTCDDILHQLEHPVAKQHYNDELDRKLLDYYELSPGTVMTLRHYLEIVTGKVPGIEQICAHPGEDRGKRLAGLEQGLIKLGVRKNEGSQ